MTRRTEVRRLKPQALPAWSVPSSSFLTTSTVCSALSRPEISPGTAHGVLSFRVSPVSRRARPFLDVPSPLAVPLDSLATGLTPDCRATAPSTSGSLSEGRPSPLAAGFPDARTRFPLELSCGTSRHSPRRKTGRLAPSLIPNCQRADRKSTRLNSSH